jgi:hypothetical protein
LHARSVGQATGWSILEACVLLSLHRRGQLLVVMSALLGAVAGAGLGMMVERAKAPSAVAAPARARGAAGLVASQPGSHPAAPQAAALQSQAGDGPAGPGAKHVDRARQVGDKPGRHGRDKHRAKGNHQGKDK